MRRLRYSVPYIAGKSLPKDSDPAPRGAGPASCSQRSYFAEFQSTRPLAGRDLPVAATADHLSYFNPPAPCGAGPLWQSALLLRLPISIHPPLAGRDGIAAFDAQIHEISIHPPLAGRDHLLQSARQARSDFNPPAPCGAGLIRNRVRIRT